MRAAGVRCEKKWRRNARIGAAIFLRAREKNARCARRTGPRITPSCAPFFVDRARPAPTFAARMCERWRFMKKTVIKRVVLVAHRQGFRVLYEIENAGVGMCGVLNRALPQKNRKTGSQIRTTMHKTTLFFSAVVPDFFQAWRFFI
jgi:hypothetical protein